MKKVKNDENINIHVKVIAACAAIAIILIVGLTVTNINKDYTKVVLRKNDKTIFSVSDLTLGKLKYGDNLKKVKKQLGEPTKENDKKKNFYNYKILEYKGIRLTLRENYDDFMLTGVEITNNRYSAPRNIEIGDKITKVIKKFKVENKTGVYMYGNYSTGTLLNHEVKENVYIGLRTKKQLEYVNRDAIYDSGKVNIARLNINYKKGKVTKIMWSYDFE